MSEWIQHYPGLCDCCRRHGIVGVGSSGYGPVSFGWCMQCLRLNVEPEWVLGYLYWEVGNEGKGLIADEYLPGTFRDGRYWSWREWADTFAAEFAPPVTHDPEAWTGRPYWAPTPIQMVREWWHNTYWRIRDLATWLGKLRVKDGAVIVPDVGWRNDKADW